MKRYPFWRLFLASISAVFAPTIAAFVSVIFTIYCGLTFVVALVYTVVLGLPIAAIVNRIGLIKWWTVLGGSVAIGALPTTLLALAMIRPTTIDQWQSTAAFMALGAVFGAIGGGAFWATLWLLEKRDEERRASGQA